MRQAILIFCIVMASPVGTDAIHAKGSIGGLRRRLGWGATGVPAGGTSATAETGTRWSREVRGHMVEGAKNMIASSVASAVGKSLLQPFDSIKTVQQNSHTKLSLVAAALDILSRGGPLALWSGLGATILGSVPSIAIYFGCYQFFKGQLLPFLGTHGSIAAAAGFANLFAAVVRVPFEIVKQRLQAGVYPDTASAVTGMLKEGGVGAFFMIGGMMGQILRDIPYAIVTLLAYEVMQSAAARYRTGGGGGTGGQTSTASGGKQKKEAAAVWVSLITGALAGGLGTFVTTPMDVIKTRLMVSPHLYSGYWSAVTITLKEEGMGAFLKGAVPRLIHKMPANSVFFVVYEAMRHLLGCV